MKRWYGRDTRRCIVPLRLYSAVVRRSLLLAIILLAFPALLRAQDEPLVIGQRQQYEPIHISDFHAASELKYVYQRDKIDAANADEQRSEENRFEETISGWGTGYILHPNLIDLNMSGTFGLSQDHVRTNSINNYSNGTIDSYDVEANFLRKENVPFTLYSRRTRGLISRQFGPTLEDVNWTHGGYINIQSPVLPTRLEMYHSDQSQTGLSAADQFNIAQNVALLHSEYHPSVHQILAFDGNFSNVAEHGAGVGNNYNYNLTDVSLSHSYGFGLKDLSSLNSSIDYFDQSGSLGNSHLRWNELLRLHHTEWFDTRYQYTLDRQAFSSVTQTQQRGLAGFSYRLFKSLTVDGEGGVQNVDRSDGSNTMEVFANLGLNYRKKVPFGLLSSAFNYAYVRDDNSARTAITTIANEPETFVDPAPILIVGNGILPQSVVVTDPAHLFVYTPGADYTIRTRPGAVELDRVVGGKIASGQTVLLRYSQQPSPSNVATTNTFTYGLRYDLQQGPLKGLGVYGRYAHQEQSIDTVQSSAFVPNNYDDVLGGVDYRVWKLRFSLEEELHDSTIEPYNATRATARYADRVSLDTTLVINLGYNILDYRQSHDQLNLFTLTGQLTRQFSSRLDGDLSLTYRNQQDRQLGSQNGIEEQAELRWHFRQTSVYGLVRNAYLDSRQERSFNQYVEMGLRRDF